MSATYSTSMVTAATNSVRLPPGPRLRGLNTLHYVAEPVESLRRWRARFGDTFTLYDLSGTTVLTCDPELVARLLTISDPSCFGPTLVEGFDALLGPRSLLMLPGPEHQRERKLLLGPLCRAALPAWIDAIAQATRASLTRLRSGERLSALELMREISITCMSQILFGPDDPAEPALRRAVVEMMGRVSPSLLISRALQFEAGGLSRFGRYMKASRVFDQLLFDRIARGRAHGERDGSVLALLLATHDDDEAGNAAIRDELRTLLIGGHEATAASLAWALYYLHRDGELLGRVRDEVDALPDSAAMARAPLLDAVIAENLRLRPPAGQSFRSLAQPLELGPWSLPAGVMVSVAICLLHQREDLWPDPMRFSVDRFYKKPRPSPFAYMPFGGGSHRCVGASLAKVESAVILGTILREFELGLDELEEPAWVREGVALCPKSGVRMRLLARR